jgi:hypothetical protein
MRHPTNLNLERLATGRTSSAQSIDLQRHLYTCEDCLYRFLVLEFLYETAEQLATRAPKVDKRRPLYIVHDTGDGMIYSRTMKDGTKWIARHWGEQLAGMRDCTTMKEANAFLIASFTEMFSEHRCTENCRVIEA